MVPWADSSVRFTRFMRHTRSSGSRASPWAAASMGPRPVWCFAGSKPKSDMLATSEPGGMPSGTVRHTPTTPFAANSSMCGVAAASRQVLLPGASPGQPPMPSAMRKRSFMRGPP